MTSPTGRASYAFQPVLIVTDDFMAARVVAKFRQEFPQLITYWEEKSPNVSGAAWAQKTPDEIMADLRALFDETPARDEAQRQAEFEHYNRHLFTQSGPPPIIPIPHRPPQLAPEEVPRVVAKARAVAVFGPKRGRWK